VDLVMADHSPFVVPLDATCTVPVPEGSHFPIQNLPFGLARLPDGSRSVVVRIGDQAIVLRELIQIGRVSGPPGWVGESLTGLGTAGARDLRRQIVELLGEATDPLQGALLSVESVQLQLPFKIPAFVDFYSGIHHASNVGTMFRPEMPPLLPNYRHLPVAYNGRASTVVPSDTAVRRPSGQTKSASEEVPRFGPTTELDFELEMGFFVSEEIEPGHPVAPDDAERKMLGLVLVNDWSARDVQRWEYQPLGPFLAKSFATSISPWVVTLDALEPFRAPGPLQEPAPLPHLSMARSHHFDLVLEVYLQSQRMTRPQLVSRSNAAHLYWSFAQQLAHLTSNGCGSEAGDLYASGTISGPDPSSFGSMLELAWKGTKPLELSESGEFRSYLADGDTVTMTAYGARDGLKIGLGEVRGTVLPAT